MKKEGLERRGKDTSDLPLVQLELGKTGDVPECRGQA